MIRKLVSSYLGYHVDRLEIWHRLNWGRIFIRGEILQETPIITDRPLSRSFLKKRSKLFSHTCAAEQCNHIPCVEGGKKEKKNLLAIKNTNLVVFFHNTFWVRLDNTAD